MENRPDVERRLEEGAKRLRQSKIAMLETLADEALRMRRFSWNGFAGPEEDRRAYVQGTGLEVWEVIMLARDYGPDSRSLMLEAHPLTNRTLDSSLAYYREFPEEIDWHLRENDRTPEEWAELYPGIVPGVPLPEAR